MKDQTISFFGPDMQAKRSDSEDYKVFDWDKAAEIIKDKLKDHPDLVCEAGLQGDWEYTGGIIFEEGKPTNESYTFLCSNWATPTLVLEFGDQEEEIDCFTD